MKANLLLLSDLHSTCCNQRVGILVHVLAQAESIETAQTHTHMFIVFAIVCVDVSWMVANSPDT